MPKLLEWAPLILNVCILLVAWAVHSGFLRRKTINDHFFKYVKVCGIIFKIRKIQVSDYLEGAKVLVQVWDSYKIGNEKNKNPMSDEKVKSHLSDVILAGVVEPVVCRKVGGDGLPVENFFTEPELPFALYNEIMQFTYGKKKVRPA